jgi:hypothetical protein
MNKRITKDYVQFTELAKWQNLGERLWPFVRFWGLCGACPEAIEAMKDLADLIGEQAVNQSAAEDMAVNAVNDIVSQAERRIMERFSEEKLAHKVGGRLADEIRQMIREEIEATLRG